MKLTPAERLRRLVDDVASTRDPETRGRQLGELLALLAGDGRGTSDGRPAAPSVLAELREARAATARELKAGGRSWREVGELLGVAGPRAQQLAVGVARSDRARRT